MKIYANEMYGNAVYGNGFYVNDSSCYRFPIETHRKAGSRLSAFGATRYLAFDRREAPALAESS